MTKLESNIKIIIFDGVCNLCNSYVNLIIAKDSKNQFRFAPLQNDFGKELAAKFQVDISKTDSIILVEAEKVYIKSTAALRIAKRLKGAYPLLFGFIIIPAFIRNWIYDLVAKNRYKWYGKRDTCMVPTDELMDKFYQ